MYKEITNYEYIAIIAVLPYSTLVFIILLPWILALSKTDLCQLKMMLYHGKLFKTR